MSRYYSQEERLLFRLPYHCALKVVNVIPVVILQKYRNIPPVGIWKNFLFVFKKIRFPVDYVWII